MGGCIKALFAGAPVEEPELSPFHTQSKRESHCVRSREAWSAAMSEKPRVRQSKQHNVTLMDINSANYHQLCVLAKITTNQAEKIVAYRVRECGGKFRSPEQLLYIPGGGITPDKLQAMGISKVVLSKTTASSQSARYSPSRRRRQEDVQPIASEHDTSILDTVNSANCHELCVLAGISMHQAENVISYKVNECQGRFSSIRQLLDIPGGGITTENLQLLRCSKTGSSGPMHYQSPKRIPPKCRAVPKSPKQVAFDLPFGVLHIGEDTSPPPRSKRSSKETLIRIASWNLECFTTKKASNLGVMEVVCMTILMNG